MLRRQVEGKLQSTVQKVGTTKEVVIILGLLQDHWIVSGQGYNDPVYSRKGTLKVGVDGCVLKSRDDGP